MKKPGSRRIICSVLAVPLVATTACAPYTERVIRTPSSLSTPSAAQRVSGPSRNRAAHRQTQIRFDADSRRAALQKLSARGKWIDVCLAPCEGQVALHGAYRVGGSGISNSSAFTLPRSEGVHIRSQTKSVYVQGAGIALVGAGTLIGAAGLAVIAVSFVPRPSFYFDFGDVSAAERERREQEDREQRSNVASTGGVILGLGAAVAVVGTIVVLSNRTEMTLATRTTAQATPHRPSELRVKVANGVWMTPRGLTF